MITFIYGIQFYELLMFTALSKIIIIDYRHRQSVSVHRIGGVRIIQSKHLLTLTVTVF